ncbi:MAG: B12-binding domain-containing radical SAM protein [Betaproteobacteria bacterium]
MRRKVYLVQPTYRDGSGRLLKGRSLHVHSLALPALSATIPDSWEKEFCLEFFDDVDLDTDASVVGITSMGYDLLRGVELARAFRERGKVVLFGGYQARLAPEAVSAHCGALVHGHPTAGEMRAILTDAEEGRLRPEYHCGTDLDFPFDYSILDGHRIRFLPVLTGVGCRQRCDFCCTAKLYGGRYHLRDPDVVMCDLRSVRRRSRFAGFVDSNLYNRRDYLLRLCRRMVDARLGLHWGAQSTIDIGDDDEALHWVRRAGGTLLFVGFETLSQANLDSVGKRCRVDSYARRLERIHAAGLRVVGFFMLGLDEDTPAAFEQVFRFVHDQRLAMPILNLLLPVPGTAVFGKLRAEGRADGGCLEEFLRNNAAYNVSCNRCFYQPKAMSRDETEAAYLRLYRRLMAPGEILWRSWDSSPLRAAILLGMNLQNLRNYFAVAGAHQRALPAVGRAPLRRAAVDQACGAEEGGQEQPGRADDASRRRQMSEGRRPGVDGCPRETQVGLAASPTIHDESRSAAAARSPTQENAHDRAPRAHQHA